MGSTALFTSTRARVLACGLFGAAVFAACSDQQPLGVDAASRQEPALPTKTVQLFNCEATVNAGKGSVSCVPAQPKAGSASADILGGPNGTYVKLTSSNVSYNSGTQIFQFDVTVQNMMNEAIGTPDGVTSDTSGIRVFFSREPVATSGTGTITVANADGTADFGGYTGRHYFRYNDILAKNAVSSVHTWQLNMPATVNTFAFGVMVETDVQDLLVINELLANPGGTISDANGEWVELYNAGSRPVDLTGLVFADSAASGRRPYNVFVVDSLKSSSLVMQPGQYFTLGATSNTTANGGVPIDYAYGVGMSFANSLDAFKIARVYGTDTLTIDRTQYASAAISAQNGISRELKNPALDNSNMDGSNWGDASVSAVYGPGGRGTPKAQNSDYVP